MEERYTDLKTWVRPVSQLVEILLLIGADAKKQSSSISKALVDHGIEGTSSTFQKHPIFWPRRVRKTMSFSLYLAWSKRLAL
jgi:hypothetical protein